MNLANTMNATKPLKIKGITLFSALLAMSLMIIFVPIIIQQEQNIKTNGIRLIHLEELILEVDGLINKIQSMPDSFKNKHPYVMNVDQSFNAIDCSKRICTLNQITQYDVHQTLKNIQNLGITKLTLDIQCLSCTLDYTLYSLQFKGFDSLGLPYHLQNTFVWP